jgi:hypothetical protein
MMPLGLCIWCSLLWWVAQEIFKSVNSETGDDTIGAALYETVKEHAHESET